jgi:hypothetical protein
MSKLKRCEYLVSLLKALGSTTAALAASAFAIKLTIAPPSRAATGRTFFVRSGVAIRDLFKARGIKGSKQTPFPGFSGFRCRQHQHTPNEHGHDNTQTGFNHLSRSIHLVNSLNSKRYFGAK